ncbi:PREDICTED: uncharacterized protein LOC100631792 isoform X2 [Amphimedon queenslandica]|uniref:Poly [ADP-ribose] polymerase n=1 Tax=Amphimedon queenslandica TaxID=400682 RepID=A0AAN0JEW4_AMPQE|nr:PREDICTED: uncharacterized protein LOC100631792 isoform X2 [Amphimedon queenslandica]|eukprot:XP_019855316.1 PREDICTED: uncharacterized protein LOC100631792 isoform X2 [Amphimedon queenslandica]
MAVRSVSGDRAYLDTKDLQKVLTELQQFSKPNWRKFGLEAGLYKESLDIIEANYKRNVEDCFIECLSCWLKRQDNVDNEGKPAWCRLAEILEKIEEKNLADKIRDMSSGIHKEQQVCTVTTPGHSIFLPEFLEEQYLQMATEFSSILSRFVSRVCKKRKTLNAVKICLVGIVPLDKREISKVDSEIELMCVLRNYCSLIKYPILTILTRDMNMLDIKKELDEFEKKMKKSYKSILAKDFAKSAIEYCGTLHSREVTFEVTWPIAKTTLNEFEQFLAAAFRSQDIYMLIHLKAVHSSLLTFVCIIPYWLVEEMKDCILKNKDLIMSKEVVRITVDGTTVFSVKSSLEPYQLTLENVEKESFQSDGEAEEEYCEPLDHNVQEDRKSGEVYACLMFCEKESIVSFTAVRIKRLTDLLEYIKDHHQFAEIGPIHYVHFKLPNSFIELNFTEKPPAGWTIVPLIKPCRLYQADIDIFDGTEESVPPSCLISFYRSPDAVPLLHYSVPLIGVADPVKFYIHNRAMKTIVSPAPYTGLVYHEKKEDTHFIFFTAARLQDICSIVNYVEDQYPLAKISCLISFDFDSNHDHIEVIFNASQIKPHSYKLHKDQIDKFSVVKTLPPSFQISIYESRDAFSTISCSISLDGVVDPVKIDLMLKSPMKMTASQNNVTLSYFGLLYYEWKGKEYLMTFTASKKLNHLLEYVEEYHPLAKISQVCDFCFSSSSNFIELYVICEDFCGWTVQPLVKPCRLYQDDIDRYDEASYLLPPTCLLSVYGSVNAVHTLHYVISLKGVADPVRLCIDMKLQLEKDVLKLIDDLHSSKKEIQKKDTEIAAAKKDLCNVLEKLKDVEVAAAKKETSMKTKEPPGESVHYLLLSGLPDGITADAVEGYLSNLFDEVNDVVLLGNGSAHAEVVDDNELSIKEFINKSHKIKKQQIEIKLTDPPDPASVPTSTATPDALGLDYYPDLIEVTFDGVIDTDIIQIYFESKHSGGKREKVVESITTFEEGIIHVKFESPDDALAVIAQEEHSVKIKKQPRKLEVRYVPLPPVKEYDMSKLIIKDIPEGMEEGYLTMFIENCLGLDEDDFTINLKPGVAMLLLESSYTDEELNKMMEKLGAKKLPQKKEQLTVERCEVNYSIYVAGITNKILASEDGLELYFESSISGGGDGVVEKIEMLAKDKAKVTFNDHSVIQRVLKKKHPKLGPSVSITECSVLDSLDKSTIEEEEEEEEEPVKKKSSHKRDNKTGENPVKRLDKKNKQKKSKKHSKTCSSSDDDETDASSPPPLVKDNPSQVPLNPVHHPLDPLLAKYVRLKPDITKGIEMEFQVKITAADAGIITISPLPSSPPDWPEKTVDMMQEFISSSLTKVDLPVPPEVGSSVYPMIIKECNDEGLQYAFGQGNNKVTIAGHIDAVTKLQRNVAELCGRMIRCVDEVELSKEDFMYFKGWALSRVQQQHKAVKLQCHDDRLSLSIDGSMKDVDEVKSKLSQHLVHSKVPVNLQPEALKFIHDDQPGRQKLNTMLKGHPEVIPYFSHSANNQLFFLLLCSNSHIDKAEHVVTTIQQEIVVQSIDLPQSFLRQISDSNFVSFQTNLAKKYSFSATVHQSKLTLVSTRSSIADVNREFHTFVTEACSVTDVINFKRGVWRLLHSTSMEKNWTDLLENMKKRGIMIVFSSKPTAQKPYIKIKGEVHNLEFAKEEIMEFQAAVKERQVTISRPGMGKYFLSNPQGQMMLKGIEYEANVCIEVEVSKENFEHDEPSMTASRSFKNIGFGTTPEMKRVNVIVGDITEFDRADVIVNAANGQLVHDAGIAASIVKRGGPAIQEDSTRYIDKNGYLFDGEAVLFPRAGNLPYKAIVHAVSPQWNRFGDNSREIALLKKAIHQSLEKSKGFTSIAIPAISSGVFGFPADVCADSILKAIAEFSRVDHGSQLNEINIVIFEDKINEFLKAAKRQLKSFQFYNSTQSLLPLSVAVPSSQTAYSFSLPRGHSPDLPTIMLPLDSEVIVHIYSETESMVERAEKKLQSTIATFYYEEIADPSISAFSDETVHELISFASDHNVDIEIDRDPSLHLVNLQGFFQDVMLVKDKICDAMSFITQEQSKKSAAALVSKTVRWTRINPDNEEEEEYGEFLNYEIEQAFQNEKEIYDAADDSFFINFEKMKERDKITNKTAIVKRLNLIKVQEQPDNWDPIPLDSQKKEKQFHLVTLPATSPEYKTAETAFNKTMTGKYAKILSIQRLQNPALYKQYAIRKKEMEIHNPKGHQNERLLWHGTSPDTLDKINTRGFDRNFAGKHATVYGKGVYFARDASYSHRYTSPDANGVRHMYYTLVLTGEFTVGDNLMICPPLKNPQVDLIVTFDATVDNVANPAIFVVYRDTQHYPAYLINYK